MNYNHARFLMCLYNIDSAIEKCAAVSPCCDRRSEEQLVDCTSVLFYIQNSIPYHVTHVTITKKLGTDMLNFG